MTEANFSTFWKLFSTMLPKNYDPLYHHLWPSSSFLIAKCDVASVTWNGYLLLLILCIMCMCSTLGKLYCKNYNLLLQDQIRQNAQLLKTFQHHCSISGLFRDWKIKRRISGLFVICGNCIKGKWTCRVSNVMTGAAVFKCCYYVDTVLLVWQQEDAKKPTPAKP